MRYARNMLRSLETRELARTASDIPVRTGLDHLDVKTGDSISGVYRRMLTLNSGRFALIERSHEFALVLGARCWSGRADRLSPVGLAGRAYPGQSGSSAVSDARDGRLSWEAVHVPCNASA